jgi:ubiquinol-cytochrome c reductase iron-sulfur subunit
MKNAALIVAILAAFGFVVVAVLHGNPALLGGLAALCAAGVAVAAGAAAVDLHAPDDLTEPRHMRGPTAPPPLPDDVLSRRGVFGRLWWLTFASFGFLAVVPLVALGRRPRRTGTAWSKGARLVTPQGRPLKADDLVVGAVETVFPEGKLESPESAALLVRVENDKLRLSAERSDWTRAGNVAYSKVCTHAGCPVALYRKASHELYCPCHQSVFDVLGGATPVSGPATRALPQLALDVDGDGYLIARGDFTDPVGPDEWWRTL